ncbi:MAG: rRNA maturation RNase YbeY [Candidatus Wallbacteria bacterium HGW-Wallbacteria-1]|jgi:probable rRNA maturation factor|uniref:Endoribonuclease YbeY n=1 Tax=Candidatus Wallbacteria bacterium HGW-Wallbacteria-1 TaxID=2013854 RepID=A0A2N1PRT9_9BACT|nr:MAG: rRNA maturation RNase YbeY [Candidatus Wallbacteria bacterium HGW-Wallbacteria-1]
MENESIDKEDIPDRRPGVSPHNNWVEILQQCTDLVLVPERSEKIIDMTLMEMGISGKEVTLTIVDQAAMSDLNSQYRGLDGPTDILTFRLADGPDEAFDGYLLGDIIICAQVLKSNGNMAGNLQKECAMILIHGALHLAGLDHQGGMEEGEEFFLIQERLLEKFSSLWGDDGLVDEGRCDSRG